MTPHPPGGHWKFQGGWESQKPKFLIESMKLNWSSRRVRGRGGG